MNREEEIAAEIRRQKFEQDRAEIASAKEVDEKLRKSALRVEAPYRIALALLLLIVAVALPFISPATAGGGIFLPWFMAALAFISVLLLRPTMKRWWARRKKLMDEPPTKVMQ